jgi:hypothetical protein
MLDNKDDLLYDIANGVRGFQKEKICNIRVEFVVPGSEERFFFSLDAALNALANNLYWDERGNWSRATRAILDTF